MNRLGRIIANHEYPSINYIDIPINDNAYNGIEVMLGPESELTNKIIVSALMEKYLKRTDYKVSNFAIVK